MAANNTVSSGTKNISNVISGNFMNHSQITNNNTNSFHVNNINSQNYLNFSNIINNNNSNIIDTNNRNNVNNNNIQPLQHLQNELRYYHQRRQLIFKKPRIVSCYHDIVLASKRPPPSTLQFFRPARDVKVNRHLQDIDYWEKLYAASYCDHINDLVEENGHEVYIENKNCDHKLYGSIVEYEPARYPFAGNETVRLRNIKITKSASGHLDFVDPVRSISFDELLTVYKEAAPAKTKSIIPCNNSDLSDNEFIELLSNIIMITRGMAQKKTGSFHVLVDNFSPVINTHCNDICTGKQQTVIEKIKDGSQYQTVCSRTNFHCPGLHDIETIMHPCGTSQQQLDNAISLFPLHVELHSQSACNLKLDSNTNKVWFNVDCNAEGVMDKIRCLLKAGGCEDWNCWQILHHKKDYLDLMDVLRAGITVNVIKTVAEDVVFNHRNGLHWGCSIGKGWDIAIAATFENYFVKEQIATIISEYQIASKILKAYKGAKKIKKTIQLPDVHHCNTCDLQMLKGNLALFAMVLHDRGGDMIAAFKDISEGTCTDQSYVDMMAEEASKTQPIPSMFEATRVSIDQSIASLGKKLSKQPPTTTGSEPFLQLHGFAGGPPLPVASTNDQSFATNLWNEIFSNNTAAFFSTNHINNAASSSNNSCCNNTNNAVSSSNNSCCNNTNNAATNSINNNVIDPPTPINVGISADDTSSVSMSQLELPVAQKQSKNTNKWDATIKMDNGVKRWYCNCHTPPVSFGSRQSWRVHRNYTRDKASGRFECEHCNMRFGNNRKLRNHKFNKHRKIYSEYEDFGQEKCSWCGRVFATNSHLKRHRKSCPVKNHQETTKKRSGNKKKHGKKKKKRSGNKRNK